MLTKTRKWLIALVLLLAFVLVACAEKVPTLSIEEGDKALTLTAGQERKIVATISGGDEKKSYTLVWESDDEWVAEVSEEGVITALNEGTAKITATVKGTSVSVTINLTVGLPNPTSLTIVKAVYVGVGGVLIGGAPMELIITTVPENAINTVVWTSLDPTVATVDQEGKVTGQRGGNVKIRATSTEDDTVRAEVDVIVFEDLEDSNVIANVMEFISEEMPTYIHEDLILPVYPKNKLVQIEYSDKDGNRHPGGIYAHLHSIDYVDTINIKIKYREVAHEYSISVLVVADIVKNDFEAIEFAKVELEKFLKEYKDDKIYDSFELIESVTYGEGDDAQEVALSWTSSNPTKFSNVGAFVRPLDDTPINLEVYIVAGANSAIARHKVVLNGYTQEEKMEYLKENVLPKVTELEGSNVLLPQRDTKFSTSIEWTTNNASVLTNAGKMDPFLEVITNVVLTAKITYNTKTEGFSFVEEVEFPITVKPAINDAQKIVLDLGNRLEETQAVPTYFPWGAKEREGGNVLSLPNKVGGDSAFKDLEVRWASLEEGLFDENWTLLKQYLRYHEVKLAYEITSGDDTATGEYVINVGIAKVANTEYIGGETYGTYSKFSSFDELHTFSQDDALVTSSTTVYSAALGGWSGISISVDYTDENGSTKRYTWMVPDRYTFTFTDTNVIVDENGNMTKASANIATNSGHGHGNRFQFYVNHTGKDVKIPIAFYNFNASSYTVDVNGNKVTRQASLTFDGYRAGFAMDKDGKIIFGNGSGTIQAPLIEAAVTDDEGNVTVQDYVLIPAGGIGFTSNVNTEFAVPLGDIFFKKPELKTVKNEAGEDVEQMVYGQAIIEYFNPIR